MSIDCNATTTTIISTATETHGDLYTMAVWVYPRSLGEGNQGSVMSHGDASADRRLGIAIVTATSFLITSGWGTTGGTWQVKYPFAFNTWIHIVVTYDAGSINNDPRCWISGQEISTTTSVTRPAGTAPVDNKNWRVANNSATTVTWDGLVQDAAAWKAILSDAEIRSVYLFGNAAVPSNLSFIWRMDNESSPTATDSSGNGFDATVTNGAVGTDGLNIPPGVVPTYRYYPPFSFDHS